MVGELTSWEHPHRAKRSDVRWRSNDSEATDEQVYSRVPSRASRLTSREESNEGKDSDRSDYDYSRQAKALKVAEKKVAELEEVAHILLGQFKFKDIESRERVK